MINGVGDVLAGSFNKESSGQLRKSSSGSHMQAAIHAQENVFSFEMHHQRVDLASPGDMDGLIIKGLNMNNMSRFW